MAGPNFLKAVRRNRMSSGPLGPHEHKRLPLFVAGGIREQAAFRNYCKVRGWDPEACAGGAWYCPECDHIEINGARIAVGNWLRDT